MAPRVPSLISGINVYALPLSTKEGFVLSRIDGSSSVEDISIMVGIRQEELLSILERLAELGAVHLSWFTPRKSAASNKGGAASSPSKGGGGAPSAPRRADSAVARMLTPPDEPLYKPAELDEPAEISLEVKKRILNAFYALEERNYYELLGVPRDAEKKAIRSAYFELSRLFHPDAFFGKKLGSFKTKMEVVFKRLTEAYEALGRAAKRKEYDDYLAATMQTTVLRETLEQVSVHATPPTPIPESEPAPPPRQPLRAVLPPAGPEASIPSAASLRPPATPDERRALARERLRRQLRPDSDPSAPAPEKKVASEPPPPSSGDSKVRRDSAITGLRKSLRAARTVTGGGDAVIEHIKRAKAAEQAGDLLGAAGALQSALALDPERPEIQQQYDRVSKAVSRSLAENYEKQARYEEKMGKWQAAALSWARVADGRPEDANAARSAAEALLKAGGDLHRAQKYAQHAVDLLPADPAQLVVLARVFLAAGLRLNAKRELEKAVKLDPRDEMIRNLLNEAR